MKKYSLIIIIAFLIVSLPVFAARNMNKDKITDSIRDCSYFQTTTYIPRDTGSIKFKENIKGYVDGKCRYVMEWYYPNANARGLICDMNDEQRNMLYNKKIGNSHGLQGKYLQCSSYQLINNQWQKDQESTRFDLSE